MAHNILIVFALCVFITLTSAELQVINGKIKITTGTGAFCPHTVDFVSNQLAPTYAEYGQFLDIEFVAWGRATLNEDGSVTCNSGTNDCWANRLHRCVLDILKDNQDAQMHYMNCEFTKRSAFLQGSYACVQEVGLNLVTVDYCVNNPRLDTLDAEAAATIGKTLEVLNAVPSVVFNDQLDEAPALYSNARSRLKSMVCFALADVPGTNVTGCIISQ